MMRWSTQSIFAHIWNGRNVPYASKDVRDWGCYVKIATSPRLRPGGAGRQFRSIARDPSGRAVAALRRQNPPTRGKGSVSSQMASSPGSGGGVEGGVGEGPTTLDELYKINVVPAELHFKFRKELQGLRVGVNLEVSSGPILINSEPRHKPQSAGCEFSSLLDYLPIPSNNLPLIVKLIFP